MIRRIYRLLTIRRHIVASMESIGDYSLSTTYQVLKLLREWLDAVEDDRDYQHDAVVRATRLRRGDEAPRHVWAYSGGRRVSGPLVACNEDGSASLFDVRSSEIVHVLPGEVADGDVRASRPVRREHPVDSTDVQARPEADVADDPTDP